MSLPGDAEGWSVIVAFPGHAHLLYTTIFVIKQKQNIKLFLLRSTYDSKLMFAVIVYRSPYR